MRRLQYARRQRYLYLALLAIVFLCGPLLLDEWSPEVLANVYGKDHQVFELMGFVGAFALAAAAALELAGKRRSWRRLILVLLPTLTLVTFLNYLAEHSSRPWDYMCYENAAKAILDNADPYRVAEKAYLYPPLLAEALAGIYRATAPAALAFRWSTEMRWKAVFVFVQSFQFLLLCTLYGLLYRWARACGAPIIQSVCLVAALLIFNVPLFRTLRHCQINLWILNAWLVGVLWAARSPWIAGAAVAVGAHLKLYPALLAAVFLLTRRYAAAVAALLSGALILLLLTSWGSNWTVWRQFLAAPGYQEFFAYRNGSVFSVAPISLYFLTGTRFWLGRPGTLVALCIATAVLVWFAVRFVKRNASVQPDTQEKRFRGHAMDAILLSLLVSPIVWEHHYVLALPAVVWGLTSLPSDTRLKVGLAALLIFAVPSFDVFLLGYSRLCGVLLLTVLSAPGRSLRLPTAPNLNGLRHVRRN